MLNGTRVKQIKLNELQLATTSPSWSQSPCTTDSPLYEFWSHCAALMPDGTSQWHKLFRSCSDPQLLRIQHLQSDCWRNLSYRRIQQRLVAIIFHISRLLHVFHLKRLRLHVPSNSLLQSILISIQNCTVENWISARTFQTKFQNHFPKERRMHPCMKECTNILV